MFEDYVRATVRIAREKLREHMEKYEHEQQLDEERRRERKPGQADG
jgi:hypothetical protein